MHTRSRRQLDKRDLDRLLEYGYIAIPSTVRGRLMPVVIDEYRRLTDHPDFHKAFYMDDPQYVGEDGDGPDIGYMPRDPSKKDKKFITHFSLQLIAEVNARGFTWDCCPNLVSAIMQIQAEALIAAADMVRLLEKHCFEGRRFYGQGFGELFRAGQSSTVTRMLNYLPQSQKQPKGTAATHWDRNLLTLHFGSSHRGLYMIRGGKIEYLDDMDPDNVLMFLGTKLWWMTDQDPKFAGLAHGVVESDSDERNACSRVAGITFTHLALPPAERVKMCRYLDDQREELAQQFFRIRGRNAVEAPVAKEPVAA